MRINTVTITGADDWTSLLDLSNLSQICPFVEWGILFSKSKEGEARYPSLSKREYFAALVESLGLRLSAHFCGWYSKEVLEKRNFSLLENLDGFDRVQLNYNFKNSTGWDVRPLIDWTSKHPEKSIILQANAANSHTISYIHSSDYPKNIHFLYDSSGGRGTELQKIRPPFDSYTGYSGGISPENVAAIAKSISERKEQDFAWIDMESGVRTDNKLDIQKVTKVLEICQPFIV